MKTKICARTLKFITFGYYKQYVKEHNKSIQKLEKELKKLDHTPINRSVSFEKRLSNSKKQSDYTLESGHFDLKTFLKL